MRICEVEGCGRRHLARGYCGKHYQTFSKYGTAVVPCQARGHWTDDEERVLISVYSDMTNEDIAANYFPERDANSIYTKARKLGLKKSSSHKSKVYSSAASGHAPWNKKPQSIVVCATCLKEFARHDKYLSTVNIAHCSKACADVSRRKVVGESHPLYTREKRICKWCSSEFVAKAAKVRYGEALFCSRSCMGSHSVRKQAGRRSSLEKSIEKCLDFLGIEHIPQKKMGVFNVDFYLPRFNLIIECDGDYWHSLPKQKDRDKRKNQWAFENKIGIARIKESDIRNSPMASLIYALEQAGVA